MNDVALREYLEARIEDLAKSVDQRIELLQERMTAAEKSKIDARMAAWSFVVSLIVGSLMLALSRIWR